MPGPGPALSSERDQQAVSRWPVMAAVSSPEGAVRPRRTRSAAGLARGLGRVSGLRHSTEGSGSRAGRGAGRVLASSATNSSPGSTSTMGPDRVVSDFLRVPRRDGTRARRQPAPGVQPRRAAHDRINFQDLPAMASTDWAREPVTNRKPGWGADLEARHDGRPDTASGPPAGHAGVKASGTTRRFSLAISTLRRH